MFYLEGTEVFLQKGTERGNGIESMSVQDVMIHKFKKKTLFCQTS